VGLRTRRQRSAGQAAVAEKAQAALPMSIIRRTGNA